jgi:(R,R)-butanediol dehydrogenase/meso-butanediol dehydrogenase/diacetyl reductase
MKAAMFKRLNEMAVGEVPKPVAGEGEVVLKVHNCGICGSDLHAVRFGFGMPPDSVMGHEFCGEIEQIGTGVTGYEIGERVTSLPFISCGVCERCRRGRDMHCVKFRGLGLGQLPGAYAEFVLCGAGSLFKVPDQLSSREGALIEPLAVGLHGVKRSRLQRGSSCVVMGAGPVGLSTLIWCKAKGAETVVVSEMSPKRSELALKLGATAVVNPNETNPADKLRELAGRRPDVVFECIGVKSTLSSAIGMVAIGGQIVVLGVCMEEDQISPATCVFKDITLDFTVGYMREDFRETIDAMVSGLIDPKPLITDVIPIDQVPAMFQTLAHPTSQAKVMVEFPH